MKLTRYEQTGELPNVDRLRKKHGTAAKKKAHALQPLRKKRHSPGCNRLPDDVVALMLKRYQDPAWLVSETAAAAGVTVHTVRRYARIAGLPGRPQTHRPRSTSDYEAIWLSRQAGETYEQAAEKGNVSPTHASRIMRAQLAMTEKQRVIVWNAYRREQGRELLPMPE